MREIEKEPDPREGRKLRARGSVEWAWPRTHILRHVQVHYHDKQEGGELASRSTSLVAGRGWGKVSYRRPPTLTRVEGWDTLTL